MTQAAAPQQLQQKSIVELQREIADLRHALFTAHGMLAREMTTVSLVLTGAKARTLLVPVYENLSSALRIMEGSL